MTQFTNLHAIDLSLAVWLVNDDYDFVPGDRTISMTALLKPVRQIILSRRVTSEETVDLSELIARQIGHAVHNDIEIAWKKNYKRNLKKLGINDATIEKVRINPEPEEITEDMIPVFIEKRSVREIGGWKVSGKLDMSLNYRLKDAKTTSVYTYIKGSKDEDYSRQMSGYKWLNPDLVRDNEGDIQFIFTDWQKAMSLSTPGYPPIRVKNHTIPLYSEAETGMWIEDKITTIMSLIDAEQSALPRCTDDELWVDPPKYKYYSDPNKTDGRATKNFDDLVEANRHLAEKGKGVVLTVTGTPKACLYCPAFEICEQRMEYEFD